MNNELKNKSMEQFREYVSRQGLRQTSQRFNILEVFLGTERHLTVQELADLVRRQYPTVGYATVSRTVKLLLGAEICRQIDFGDGVLRYEHKFGHEHHDHLICTKCGRFEELFSPELENLQAAIVKEFGYIQQAHKLDIFGICPACRSRNNS